MSPTQKWNVPWHVPFLLIIFLLQLLFSRFGCFPVSATVPCFVRQGRGCCWVMQWILPPPKATSRVCTPTTSRSGNISCTCRTARASFSSPYLGQDHAAVDDEEVHIRRDADLAVLTGDGALHGVDGLGSLQPTGLTGQAQLMHLQPPTLGVGGLRQGAVGVLRRLIEGLSLSSVQIQATSPGATKQATSSI